jgi:hypothetical protein
MKDIFLCNPKLLDDDKAPPYSDQHSSSQYNLSERAGLWCVCRVWKERTCSSVRKKYVLRFRDLRTALA